MLEPSQLPAPQRSMAQISPCGPISMPAVVPQARPSASLAHCRCGGPNGSGTLGIAIWPITAVPVVASAARASAIRIFMRIFPYCGYGRALYYGFLPLLRFGQGEDIDGVTYQRAIALKGEHAAGPDLWAAAIIAGWNGH